jgi:hypothetical protein
MAKSGFDHFETFRLRAVLFRYLNYPLYVPQSHRNVLEILAKQGIPGMTSELERLSALGSPWASATLGYLSLLPSPQGVRNPKRAVELCSKAAAAGDSYALYVTGWAQYVLTQDRVGAAESILASSKMHFAPATLAMAFFLWPKTAKALDFVSEAARCGHKAAWTWKCGFFRTGRLGFIRRTLGYILTPLARMRYVAALWINPFGEDVLLVTLTDQRPAYRSSN